MAFVALNKQEMTAFVGTIYMRVARFSTLVAIGYDVICDTFSQTMIEYEIFSDKFALQSLLFYLTCILDDSSFELVNVFEPLMFEVSTCFFTTNTSSTVHHQFF